MNKAGEGRRLRAVAYLGVCAGFVTAMQGCATIGSRDPQGGQGFIQERLEQSLIAAEKAHKHGQSEQALQLLDDASRIDPAAKQPWLRKAQIHFEARQYGPAIAQAHEVLQRDVGDITAQSILAVSGLRVSAAALNQLVKANEFTGVTRSEAENVARVIHQAMRDPALIAPASVVPSSTPPGSARRGARGALRPAAPGPTSRGNPFGALQ